MLSFSHTATGHRHQKMSAITYTRATNMLRLSFGGSSNPLDHAHACKKYTQDARLFVTTAKHADTLLRDIIHLSCKDLMIFSREARKLAKSNPSPPSPTSRSSESKQRSSRSQSSQSSEPSDRSHTVVVTAGSTDVESSDEDDDSWETLLQKKGGGDNIHALSVV